MDATVCISMQDYKKLTEPKPVKTIHHGWEQGTGKNFTYTLAGQQLEIVFRNDKVQTEFLKKLGIK